MLKIETLPKMLLHLKHMSENVSSLRIMRIISLNAVYIGQLWWVQQNSSHFYLFVNLGLPQNPKVVKKNNIINKTICERLQIEHGRIT